MSQKFVAGEVPSGAGERAYCAYVTSQEQDVWCVKYVSPIKSTVQKLVSADCQQQLTVALSSKRNEFCHVICDTDAF
jgi:hypothetical protein